MRCPLAGWALSWCGGCGIGAVFFARVNAGACVAAALALAVVAGAGLCHARWRGRAWVLATVWAVVFAAGMAAGARTGLAGLREKEFLRANQKDLFLEGWVSEVRAGESTTGKKRHEIKLEDVTAMNSAGERQSVKIARLEMRCNMVEDGDGETVGPGEWWRFRAARSQGLFWPKEDGARAFLIASGRMADAQRLDKKSKAVQRRLARVRRGVADRLATGTGPEDAVEVGIVRALLLGLRGDIPWEVRVFFRYSGTAHLFAISGLVVGMVAAMMMLMLRFTRLRLDRWGFVLIPGILFFGAMTGAAPSALRACLMLTIYWLVPLLGSRISALSAISGAAVILAGWDPANVVDTGFWLSFTVTAGLIVFTQPVMRAIAWLRRPRATEEELEVEKLHAMRNREPAFRRWLRTWFESLCAVSFTAWAVAAPIGIFVFNQFVPAGVLANMVIVPLTFLVVFVSGVSLTVGLVWTQGAVWLNHVLIVLARCMRGTATFFAIEPLGAMEMEWKLGLGGLAAVYLALCLAGFWVYARECEKKEEELSF